MAWEWMSVLLPAPAQILFTRSEEAKKQHAFIKTRWAAAWAGFDSCPSSMFSSQKEADQLKGNLARRYEAFKNAGDDWKPEQLVAPFEPDLYAAEEELKARGCIKDGGASKPVPQFDPLKTENTLKAAQSVDEHAKEADKFVDEAVDDYVKKASEDKGAGIADKAVKNILRVLWASIPMPVKVIGGVGLAGVVAVKAIPAIAIVRRALK